MIPALAALGPGGALGPDFRLVTVTHARLGEPAFGIAPGEGHLWATLRTLEEQGHLMAWWLEDHPVEVTCAGIKTVLKERYGWDTYDALQGQVRFSKGAIVTFEAAWKLDQGRDVRVEISMLKIQATEMAQQVIDHAMQCFGAMGMTKELPLQLMAQRARLMRIYEGPSEVHRMVISRRTLRQYA